MLPYSGMEAGHQFVFSFWEIEGHAIGFGANAAMMNRMKLMTLNGNTWKMVALGKEAEEKAGLRYVDDPTEAQRV